jgi:hypothetical protein
MAQSQPVNWAVGAVLRVPALHRIGSSYVMLLRFRGRKTGRRYTIPVGYYRDGGTVLTTTDDRWWRNLTPSAPVHLLLERQWCTGMAHAVDDEQDAIAGMAALVTGCPRYAGWIEIGKDADGKPSMQDLQREVRSGRVLIRVTGVTDASTPL